MRNGGPFMVIVVYVGLDKFTTDSLARNEE